MFKASWSLDQGKGGQELERLESSSMMDENDDEIGCFQATSIEGNETDEERLQRALAMSMVNRNDNDEIGSL